VVTGSAELLIKNAFFCKRVLTAEEFDYLWNDGAGRRYSDLAGMGGTAQHYTASTWTARHKDLIYEVYAP